LWWERHVRIRRVLVFKWITERVRFRGEKKEKEKSCLGYCYEALNYTLGLVI
jgi:hypothetical protein